MSNENSNTFQIETIQNINQFDQIRDFWIQNQNHPRHTFESYLVEIKYFKDILNPYILVFKKDDEIKAIILGVLIHRKLVFKFNVLKLYRKNANVLVMFNEGVIGNIDKEMSEQLIGFLNRIHKQQKIDMFRFPDLELESELFKSAQQIPSFLFKDHFIIHDPRWLLNFPQTFEEYIQSLSKNLRSQYRRKTKKLSKEFEGQFHYKYIREKPEDENYLQDMESIASKSWQAGYGTSYKNDPRQLELTEKAFESEGYRAVILYIKDQPKAFMQGWVYNKIYYLDKLGYDQEFFDYSLGMLTMFYGIEQFIQEKQITTIDMGQGGADYKRRFSNQKTECGITRLFAPTINGVILNFMRTSIAILNIYTKKIAKKVNAYDSLRRLKRDIGKSKTKEKNT